MLYYFALQNTSFLPWCQRCRCAFLPWQTTHISATLALERQDTNQLSLTLQPHVQVACCTKLALASQNSSSMDLNCSRPFYAGISSLKPVEKKSELSLEAREVSPLWHVWNLLDILYSGVPWKKNLVLRKLSSHHISSIVGTWKPALSYLKFLF